MRSHHRWLVGLLLLLIAGENGRAKEKELPNVEDRPVTKNLVSRQGGALPIILSAPHGGRLVVPNVSVRTGKGVKKFNRAQDMNTDRLVEKIADALEKKTGKRPYTVIARFHRKYIDANRRPTNAYEAKEAKLFYDTYHQALAEAKDQVTKRWGAGLLIDVHGQSAKTQVIFRGTQNGKTTKHLVGKFGLAALIGKTSLFGLLAQQEFQVLPKVDSDKRENDDYDGGYIVSTYGSQAGGTVDAIQLELGRQLRATKVLDQTANKIADALVAYSKHYLPKEPKKKVDSPPISPRLGQGISGNALPAP